MNGFFDRKKYNILLSWYLDFCVFDESTNFQICDIIIGL